MLTLLNTPGAADCKQLIAWLIAFAVAVIGLPYAREAIAFLLEELYAIFIQR